MKQISLLQLVTSTTLMAALLGCGGDDPIARSSGTGSGGTSIGAQTTAGGTANTLSSKTGGATHTTLTSSVVGTSTLIDTSAGGSHLATNGVASSQSGSSSTGVNLTRGGSDGGASNPIGGASTYIGGTSGNAGAVNSTHPVVCNAPECCVPLRLEPTRVDVYRVQDSLTVNLVIQPSAPDAIDAIWAPYAEISTSWAGAQTCVAERRFGNGVSYATLSCPPVTSAQPDCGDTASVEVRLRSDTFFGVQPFDPDCQSANSGSSTTLTVPVKCPVCPSSPSLASYQPCDYPEVPIGSEIDRCSVFSLPCHCLPDATTGSKLWSCPHP